MPGLQMAFFCPDCHSSVLSRVPGDQGMGLHSPYLAAFAAARVPGARGKEKVSALCLGICCFL
jgi:hypothetical protein